MKPRSAALFECIGDGHARLGPCPDASIWVVREGKVDLFAVVTLNEGGAPLRRYVCTLEPGALVPVASVDRCSFESIPLLGSRLEAMASRQLDAAEWESGLESRWHPMVGGLERLGLPTAQLEILLDMEAPKEETGRDLPAGSVVAGKGGLVWAFSGSALQLLGQARPADSKVPVPLSGRIWCGIVESPTRMDLARTSELIEKGALESAIASFDRQLALLARKYIEERYLANESRISQGWKSEADEFDHLAVAAAESLDGKRLTRADEEAADPLYWVCQKVAEWHGISIDIPESAESGGRIEDRLAALARRFRFRIRRVSLSGRWWEEDTGALLGFDRESGLPTAIVPGRGDRPARHDGRQALPRPITAEVAAGIAPVAYVFCRPFPETVRTVPDVLRFAIGGEGGFQNLFLMAVAVSLLGVLPPLVIKVLFETAIPSSDYRLILNLAAALALIHATTILIEIGYEATLIRMEGKAASRLQNAFFDRVLRLPTAFLQGMYLGKLHSKWMLFEKLYGSAAGRRFLAATLSGALSVFSLILMFVFFPVPAALVLALTLALVYYGSKVGPRQLADMRRGKPLPGHYWSLVTEALAGIRKIRLAGAEARTFNRWFAFLVERRVRFLQGLRHRNRFQTVMSVFEGGVLVVILTVFALQYDNHSLPMGSFMAFLAATKTFTHGVALLVAAMPDSSMVWMDDLPDVLPFVGAEIEDPPQRKDPGLLKGGVELTQVIFRYQGAPRPALDEISIEVNPGEFVALVGPSGCGKSTALKLLLGMETPNSGAVFYDGRNLNQMNVIAVRGQIGVVMQNSSLIPGTIFDYIAAHRPLSLAEAWEVARLVGIDEVISDLPMGMYTFISEGGSTLSGGQMQRLMIARALAAKPKILLFDEATSWLDNRTQSQIVATLARLKITRIIIAHRLSTIRQADRIYVLDKGRIVETGTYESLKEKGGLFTELARRQLT